MTVKIEFINGYLEAISCLNVGPNHSCDFYFLLLDDNHSKQNVLNHYYHSLTKNRYPQYCAEHWQIQPIPINEKQLMLLLERWFLNSSYSPKPHKENHSWIVNGFVDSLLPISLSQCELFDVQTTPPIEYEAHWNDVLFIYKNRYYLLHLGVSD